MKREMVPSAPFQNWLNARFDHYTADHRCDSTAVYELCQEVGWTDGLSGARRLHRFRRAIVQRSKGTYPSREDRWWVHTDWFPREVVEDALHRAGVNFYDVYEDYAHERDVPLEPDRWCEVCRDRVTPIDGACPWDGTQFPQYAGNGPASSRFAGRIAA